MPFDDVEFGPYDKAEQMARKAFELYEDGKMPQAYRLLDAALDINPCNSSWHFNKALTLDAMNKFDDAISEYELSLGMNPDDLEILNSLAVDYTRTGQYDLAIDTFEHIQQLDGEFEPCYCNRIITYTEMDQHDMAEQMFYLAQQIQPDCPLCYYNIGNSLFIRGQYKKAIHCWLKTAELEPTHPQIHYRIAQACWSDGDHCLAREHFLTELRTNPGDIDAIFDFSLFLLELGDVEGAKEKFNRILELNPDFAPAVFYLGEIAFNNSDYEQAVKLFEEALQKDGSLPGPRYRLAQCALIREDIGPRTPLGDALRRCGNDSAGVAGTCRQAKAYLASEVKLVPENVDVLLSMASMFLAVGDTDFGINCLLRATEIEPASADTYYWLGLASIQKGRYNEAAEFFSHALDIRADHLCALRASAELYLQMGKLDEAEERIDKALGCAGEDTQLKAIRRKVRLTRTTQRIADFVGRFRPRFNSNPNSHTARRVRRR
jgi:tetratricopeptide (TPR) repeat protein